MNKVDGQPKGRRRAKCRYLVEGEDSFEMVGRCRRMGDALWLRHDQAENAQTGVGRKESKERQGCRGTVIETDGEVVV